MKGLVLSLFPGIDLLGRAFEEAGFCVVRGPDPLWGGDVHLFHPPSGRFDGVIGGPPCKGESNLAHLNGNPGETLRHEFVRVVTEAAPRWWVMEAVKRHEALGLEPCYNAALSPRWLGERQSRKRWFHSNLNLLRNLEYEVFEPLEFKHAVLAVHGGGVGTVVRGMATYSWEEMCALQGLPEDYDLPGFTRQAKREAVGNGVPLVMGRAVVKAVLAELERIGSVTDHPDTPLLDWMRTMETPDPGPATWNPFTDCDCDEEGGVHDFGCNGVVMAMQTETWPDGGNLPLETRLQVEDEKETDRCED